MRRRIALALLVLFASASLVGCAGQWSWNPVEWTPRGQLLAARESFNTTVNVLTNMILADKFDAEDSQLIMQYAELGERQLDRWEAAVDLDQWGRAKALAEGFADILRELQAYKIQGERVQGVD